MEKFDPDFALFGILTANLSSGLEIGKAKIAYTNQVSERLYGRMHGRTIFDIVSAVAGDDLDGARLVAQLGEGNSITVEGLLNDRFVKLHCTVVRYCDEGSCDTGWFVQAGIMDITDSVVLKDLLYGTSEALKRAAWAADEDTGSHVARINRYAGKLAGLMNLDRVFIDDIFLQLGNHDINIFIIVYRHKKQTVTIITGLFCCKSENKTGGAIADIGGNRGNTLILGNILFNLTDIGDRSPDVSAGRQPVMQ